MSELLSERISRLRTAKLMSQRALAERIDVSHASIVRIENGEHKPRVDSLAAIARVLGVSNDLLLTGHEAPSHAALIAAIRRGERQEVLIAMVNRHG